MPTRRRAAVALASLAAVVLLPTTALGQSVGDDLRDAAEERDRLEDEREEVEGELARTEEEIAAVAADLVDAQSRIDALETALAALRVQLVGAEEGAAQARTSTREATEELVGIVELLDATEDDLVASRAQLDDRAAIAFMRGDNGIGLTGTLLGTTSDVGDLVHSSYYVSTVLDADRDLLERVTSATLDLERVRRDADAARNEVAAAQAAADDHERELAALTASAEQLTEDAEVERTRQQGLFDRLEDKQAATREQLEVLEQQSADVEALLDDLRSRGGGFSAGQPGVGTFVWPSDGRISSVFGDRVHPIYGYVRFHSGVDVAGGYGRAVLAANAGLVLSSVCTPGGYGCHVIIDHGGGIASLYAHLSTFTVSQGDVVAPGDEIGRTGSTGASTGPHLHFEIRVNGTPQDPMQWY